MVSFSYADVLVRHIQWNMVNQNFRGCHLHLALNLVHDRVEISDNIYQKDLKISVHNSIFSSGHKIEI